MQQTATSSRSDSHSICRALVRGGLALITLASGVTHAADPVPLTVRDVSVWTIDAFGAKFNAQDEFASRMPGFVLSRRKSASDLDRATPSPVGIITLQGKPVPEMDVLLEWKTGAAIATWPLDQTRRTRILWEDFQVLAAGKASHAVPDDHWFTALRQADRLWLAKTGTRERFLTYDLELAGEAILKVVPDGAGKDAPNRYRAENVSAFPLHDVMMFKPVEGQGWQAFHLARMEGFEENKPTRKPQPKAEQPEPVIQPASDPDALFVGALKSKELPDPEPESETATQAEKKLPVLDTTGEEFDGSYSDKASFEGRIREAKAAGRILAKVQGTSSTDGNKYFRGMFVDEPFTRYKHAYVMGATEEEYAKLAKEYKEQGYNELDMQRYESRDKGVVMIQAVWYWEESGNKPSRSAVAELSLDLPTGSLPEPFLQSLREQGLADPEIAYVTATVKGLALLNDQSVVVYRMDREQLDYLLPLEITPEPEKLVRVGIVIVLNSDPDLPRHVEGIVEQLGDPKWKQREAAMAKLRKLGSAARQELQKAAKNTDLEIAYRAEILLDELKAK